MRAQLSRRGFLGLLLGAAVAEAAVDWERLLWVPKPIITVPAMPPNAGELVASAWEAYVRCDATDNIFDKYWLLSNMTKAEELRVGTVLKVVYA